MKLFGDSMSVLGRVMCDAHKACVPERVHRLDHDLELCVCMSCGGGWVRDVSPFDKLNEALSRVHAQCQKLGVAVNRLAKSLEQLNKALQ